MLLFSLLVDINHVVLLWLNVEQRQWKRMPSGWYGSGDENEINTNNQSNEMRMKGAIGLPCMNTKRTGRVYGVMSGRRSKERKKERERLVEAEDMPLMIMKL